MLRACNNTRKNLGDNLQVKNIKKQPNKFAPFLTPFLQVSTLSKIKVSKVPISGTMNILGLQVRVIHTVTHHN